MKFCAIIPDRGDRPELTEHCLKQLDRMTVKPDELFHIRHKPYTSGYDLVHRIKVGVNLAKDEGFDWCFIIENDDYYPPDYFLRFQVFMDKYDFIGDDKSTYYNLRNLTHKTFAHQFRSSLFTTAFKLSALNNFEWPAPHTVFVDIDLWKYARFKKRMFINTGAVGIKHNMGLCGGKGHKMNMDNSDTELKWLKGKVDKDSFEFYTRLVERLKEKVA